MSQHEDVISLMRQQTSETPQGYQPPQAPGTYAVKSSGSNTHKFAVTHDVKPSNTYESLMTKLGDFLGTFGQIPCCCCFPNPFKLVPEGTIGLVSRFGKYYKTSDPGLVKVNPLTESIRHVDTKIQIETIGPVPIVTKDNVTVDIESVVYWHVIDPYLATYGVSHITKALVERTQTTLRAVLGTKDLQDMIENRDTISSDITDIIDKPAHNWGIGVETILIKDIKLSPELQESLASAATQKRIGESKVIQAKAEVDAAILMREAAEILNTPAAMQMRTLDSLVTMAKTNNTKVLFVPVNQDYSNGSINAFGGAGSTLGINAISPPHPQGAGGGEHVRTNITTQNSLHVGSSPPPPHHVPGSGNPISQSVKDSVIYSQLAEM
ncbi:hypothetical protein GGI12_002535 [Dipsacomyces acuminosporus]|nr:hypothetical protein GGI12_002535 [Dipsacomyces acuminosporus]